MKRLFTEVVVAVVLGWMSSTLIVLAYGKLVPQSYPSPELQAFQEKLKTRGYLAQEQLEEMDRTAALLHEEVQRRIKEEDRSLWFGELRDRALIVSWLQWVILGFVGLKNLRAAWLVSAMLFLLSTVHALSVTEAFAFSIATLFGFYCRHLAHNFARRDKSPPATG